MCQYFSSKKYVRLIVFLSVDPCVFHSRIQFLHWYFNVFSDRSTSFLNGYFSSSATVSERVFEVQKYGSPVTKDDSPMEDRDCAAICYLGKTIRNCRAYYIHETGCYLLNLEKEGESSSDNTRTIKYNHGNCCTTSISALTYY